MQPTTLVRAPSKPLAPYVSHYWLSANNTRSFHSILPDARADLVIEVADSAARGWVYGTVTTPTTVPVGVGCHYLGIQFLPGQSRHFIRASARELTDHSVCAQDALGFSLDGVAERIGAGDVFSALDAMLLRWLARHPPSRGRVDAAIHALASVSPRRHVHEVASGLGMSRRQLERLFLDHVGISPMAFVTIQRCRAAARALAARANARPADLAADMGYADQSHMTREFKRLLGRTPARIRNDDVAFVQDLVSWRAESGASSVFAKERSHETLVRRDHG